MIKPYELSYCLIIGSYFIFLPTEKFIIEINDSKPQEKQNYFYRSNESLRCFTNGSGAYS